MTIQHVYVNAAEPNTEEIERLRQKVIEAASHWRLNRYRDPGAEFTLVQAVDRLEDAS